MKKIKLLQEQISQMKQAETKTSLWERAHAYAAQFDGPVLELAPGFSFDSDSTIKLYEYNGKVIA